MNLNHLYYFRALAKEEHYTRTADMLSITQPSLSHAISCLESELGVKLFEKQGRNAKLTKYGALFLRYVEQSLDMLDEGKRVVTETSGTSGGFIDMGYIFTLGSHFIPNLIKGYLEEKGKNHIHFSFGQGTTKKIVEELKDGKYDLAFSSYVEGEDELEFIPVGQEELVLITPKDHPLAQKEEIDLLDTIEYDYVYFTKNSGLRPVIDSCFSRIKRQPTIAYEGEEDSSVAGLVAAGLHPSPVPYADIVTTTTHKTLRGPRGGLILCKEKYAKQIDKAIFPGVQGGPLMHVIAAKAVALGEALKPEFKEYAKQIIANCQALAEGLIAEGFRLVSGGTDNHLLLVDVRGQKMTGKTAEHLLDEVGVTCNKNTIPFDPESPFVTSGIRLGTAAVTTRGFKEADMKEVAVIIGLVLNNPEDAEKQAEAAQRVAALCAKYPMYPML